MTEARHRRASSTPLAEWVWAGLGLVVLAAMFAALIEHAMSSGHPADVEVEATRIERARGSWRVDVRATNHGGTTAEDVVVHGELRRGDELLGEAEVVLAFVPAGSERTAALVFHDDPRSAELTLEVRGFVRP